MSVSSLLDGGAPLFPSFGNSVPLLRGSVLLPAIAFGAVGTTVVPIPNLPAPPAFGLYQVVVYLESDCAVPVNLFATYRASAVGPPAVVSAIVVNARNLSAATGILVDTVRVGYVVWGLN